MSPSFDARLREQLLDGLSTHRARRRRRDRALLALGSVVLVVAVAVGLAASSSDDRSSTERTDSRPPAPSTVGPSSTTTTTSTTTTSTSSTTTTTTTEPPPEPTVHPPGGPALDPAVADEAAAVVRDLLSDLRAGDIEGALKHYQGHYGFGDARAELQALIDSAGGLLADPDPDIIVNPSFGWTAAYPVVTVVSRAGEIPVVGSFLVDGGPQEGRTGLLVETLADVGESDPPSGTPVRPGDTITLGAFPTEGGARAFVGTVEIGTIVDQTTFTTSVVLPDDISGEVVLTLSVASPELPGGEATWYPVAG